MFAHLPHELLALFDHSVQALGKPLKREHFPSDGSDGHRFKCPSTRFHIVNHGNLPSKMLTILALTILRERSESAAGIGTKRVCSNGRLLSPQTRSRFTKWML